MDTKAPSPFPCLRLWVDPTCDYCVKQQRNSQLLKLSTHVSHCEIHAKEGAGRSQA